MITDIGYRDNNKYNKSNNVIINQKVSKKMSKYFCLKLVYHVILTKIPSIEGMFVDIT